MKKEYLSPELEIVSFSNEDIITTSLMDGGAEGGGGDYEWGVS